MNRACKAASFNTVGIELQTQAKKKKKRAIGSSKERSIQGWGEGLSGLVLVWHV